MDTVESGKKQSRAPNFSTREKHVLFDVISKYKDIIENKKTDASSTTDKNKAWEKVSMEFNAISPNFVCRPIISLKKFYENKKKEVRKQVAEERKEVLLTGGGSLPEICKDSDQEKLLGIMNPGTVFGINNPFGSDAFPLPIAGTSKSSNIEVIYEIHSKNTMENEDIVMQESEEIEVIKTQNPDVEINESGPWKKYKASDLAPTLASALKTPNKDSSRRRPATTVRALTSSTLAEKYERLVDMRLSIAQMEIKKMENDATFDRQEKVLKLESLQLDIQIKKEKLKELHKNTN